MRFGVCTPIEQSEVLLDVGFDYVEVSASRFTTAEDFDAQIYHQAKAEVSNLFFPSTIRLFGAEKTPYRDYCEVAFSRAQAIGLDTMVIGSGAARRAPQPNDDAFTEIVAELQQMAKPFGIRLAPESLNRSETNVGNDLASLARSLASRGVGYTADSYHVLVEWKQNGGDGVPTADFWADQLPFRPLHVHVSTIGRTAPVADDLLLPGFVRRLHELGYQGRISLEAQVENPEPKTWSEILGNLRSLFA